MTTLLEQKVIALKCQRCRHKWHYKGKNKYVATCPHCRTYVTIKKSKILLIGKRTKPKQSLDSRLTSSKRGVPNHE